MSAINAFDALNSVTPQTPVSDFAEDFSAGWETKPKKGKKGGKKKGKKSPDTVTPVVGDQPVSKRNRKVGSVSSDEDVPVPPTEETPLLGLPSVEEIAEKAKKLIAETYAQARTEKTRSKLEALLGALLETLKKIGKIFASYQQLLATYGGLDSDEKLKTLKKLLTIARKYSEDTSMFHGENPDFAKQIQDAVASIESCRDYFQGMIDADKSLMSSLPGFFQGLKPKVEAIRCEDKEVAEAPAPAPGRYAAAAFKGKRTPPKETFLVRQTSVSGRRANVVDQMLKEAKEIAKNIYENKSEINGISLDQFVLYVARALNMYRISKMNGKDGVCTLNKSSGKKHIPCNGSHSHYFCSKAVCKDCKGRGRLTASCPCNDKVKEIVLSLQDRPCVFCACDNHASHEHVIGGAVYSGDDSWE
jgi:hypothetical protein